VLGHVRRQHHVNHHLANGLLLMLRHTVQKEAIWLVQDPEAGRQMVVLVRAPIVRVNCPIVERLDQKVIVEPLVLEIVHLPNGCFRKRGVAGQGGTVVQSAVLDGSGMGDGGGWFRDGGWGIRVCRV
jgi:hypothetical protein